MKRLCDIRKLMETEKPEQDLYVTPIATPMASDNLRVKILKLIKARRSNTTQSPRAS